MQMNEFKGEGNGEAKDDESKWTAEDASSQRGSIGSQSQTSRGLDLPDLPKSGRRHSSTGGAIESPTTDKSEKKSRKSSRSGAKDLADGKSSSQHNKDGGDSSSNPSSDIPKKARRKKSKETSRKSSRSKSKESQDTDGGSESGSISKSLSIDNFETASTLSALEEEEAENGGIEVS